MASEGGGIDSAAWGRSHRWTVSAAVRTVGSALLALAPLAACILPPSMPAMPLPVPSGERTYRTLRQRDPQSGVVVREWGAWLSPGKRAAKQGLEVGRYPGGALRFERGWEAGRPSGEWLAWYESGALRSRIEFAGPGTPTEATFWHESGALAARGPAWDSVRGGTWTYFHPDGTRAAQGEYSRSMRVGEWSFWEPDGQLAAQGRYERNRRIGSWYVRPGGSAPAVLDLELALDARAGGVEARQ